MHSWRICFTFTWQHWYKQELIWTSIKTYNVTNTEHYYRQYVCKTMHINDQTWRLGLRLGPTTPVIFSRANSQGPSYVRRELAQLISLKAIRVSHKFMSQSTPLSPRPSTHVLPQCNPHTVGPTLNQFGEGNFSVWERRRHMSLCKQYGSIEIVWQCTLERQLPFRFSFGFICDIVCD